MEEKTNSTLTRGEKITELTKLKLGYVGVGNAGCQVGIKIATKGIETFLVNTSFKDLRNEVIPNGMPSYLIEDVYGKSRGAGRSRDFAKNLFEKSAIMDEPTFDNFLKDKDIIIVGAAASGGTGSGISPSLCYMISEKYPNKDVMMLELLPRKNESINSQFNTADCMEECRQLNVPYLVYDLDKSEDTAEATYINVANLIADHIGILAGDMASMSEYGMIDERDLLTVAVEPGLMLVGKKTDIKPEGLQKEIINTIKSSMTVDPQKDKFVKYFALFLEVPEEVADSLKTNNFDELKEEYGEPWDIFVNYTIVDKSTASFGFIASGMSYPNDRLAYCTEAVKAYNAKRKSREYDRSQEVESVSHLSLNSNINKLAGSSDTKVAEGVPKEKPSFLKARS